MKTANLAIVFTDIQGFSERTSRQTLEENQRLLRVHGDLLIPIFRSFGGRIIKSIGDAFLVTFESPTQAVLSGMAIQDRLWSYNRSAPDAERLDVRVAINVGEVRLESQDVFGEPVNIAARVESIAEAGEVFFTEAVYLAMNKAEVPSREVGTFELKGIPGKIRVFRVPRAPYRVETPAPEQARAEPPASPEQPPFGNLALSRVPEVALTPPSHVAERLVRGTRTALLAVKSPRAWPLPPRVLALGGAALALVLVVGLGLLLRGSPVASAITFVAEAPTPREKGERAEAARRLIAEQDAGPGEREWWTGQLEEALDRPREAIRHYTAAAKAGETQAPARLVELLGDKGCTARVEAAEALGALKWRPARSALETLAKEGGPGDSRGLFGCNSRGAAEDALKRLGR
ncbi:adenylate/guanylate cyclase domain-containing protein [Archangium primigenium]|uniref:adenylate/guanylate cyclase domain-containing protein n=1 Tax=[Archangium] primigenium TaxID=2792470 RepID=UPI0019562B16|nr:adenylate/guanylate cyclase domain-containing protein [Archangium primigenium]MBM7117362.1 adenylate/guanylate cyclase domain-containing protein [Archangium primigenium]